MEQDSPATSNIDSVWLSLPTQQKVWLLKSRTKDFGINKDQLREILFTLPISDTEANAAFSSAVVDATRQTPVKQAAYPAIAWYVGKNDARIDRYNLDGTITVIDAKLYKRSPNYNDEDIYGGTVEGIVDERESVTMHDYIPLDIFDGVSMLIEYTVMIKRCKEYKYPESAAKERLLKHYRNISTMRPRTPDEKAEHSFRLYVEAVASGCDVEVPDAYGPDGIEDILACLAKKIYQRTGIDVYAGRIEDIYKDYTPVAVGDMEELKRWMKIAFKAKRAAYFEKPDGNTIRVCGKNTVDLRKYNWESAIEQINLLIYPCSLEIDVKDGDSEEVKYLRLKRV